MYICEYKSIDSWWNAQAQSFREWPPPTPNSSESKRLRCIPAAPDPLLPMSSLFNSPTSYDYVGQIFQTSVNIKKI